MPLERQMQPINRHALRRLRKNMRDPPFFMLFLNNQF